MNKRGRKKVEKKKRQRLHKIFDAALDVNGLGIRTVEKTNFMPTAFFDYAGHVGSVIVQINKDGWEPMKEPDLELWILTSNVTEQKCAKVVSQIRGYQK